MSVTNSTPRIYVASLSDYNAGRLHGCWIDAAQDADDIHADIQAMLATSGETIAEEWAIHDYEEFGGISISEYESIETVAVLAHLLAEHGAAIAAYYDNQSGYWAENLDEIEESFRESFQGEHDSEEEFAQQLADDLGMLQNIEGQGWPASYIDWAAATRDLFCGDYWSARSDGGVYVFRSI